VVLCKRWRLVGPPVPALRGRALNHPVVRWLKTVVLSDRGKGVARPRQVGTGKAFQKRSAGVTRRGVVVEASKAKKDDIKIGGPFSSLERSLAGARVPGQVVSGVEAARVRSAALARNVRRRASIWRPGP
jgi:hypothetical protein